MLIDLIIVIFTINWWAILPTRINTSRREKATGSSRLIRIAPFLEKSKSFSILLLISYQLLHKNLLATFSINFLLSPKGRSTNLLFKSSMKTSGKLLKSPLSAPSIVKKELKKLISPTKPKKKMIESGSAWERKGLMKFLTPIFL